MPESVEGDSTGKTSLRRSGRRRGRWSAHDCADAGSDSMHDYATGPRKTGPTAAESTQNHRVTARTVRNADGSTRTVYRVDGREVGSRAELEAVMGGQR